MATLTFSIKPLANFGSQMEDSLEEATKQDFDHWGAPINFRLMAAPTKSAAKMRVVTTLTAVYQALQRASR